jgi:NAD(P)H-nitrite reductase large subunit
MARSRTYGKDGSVRAETLGGAGDDAAVYVPQPPFTSLKITGIDVFSAGALAAVDDCDEEITLHDAKGGIYKKVMSWSRSTANFPSA